MKSFTKENKFPIILLILLVGTIIAYGAIFNSSGYSVGVVGVALLLGICLIVDIEQSYYVLAFCFPLARILKLSAASFSIIPFLYVIVIVKLFIFERQKLKIVPLISILSLAVIQIISIIFYNSSITSVISLLLSCFFVLYSASFFSSKSKIEKNMLRNTVLFFAIAVALNILLSDLFPQSMWFINAAKQEVLETADRFGALLVEPNELSQIILVAVGFLIATFSSYKSVVAKIGIVALIAYLAINGIRTNSKSYVLTLFGLLCIMMLILIFKFFKKKQSVFALVGFLILLICGVIAGYYLIFNVIIPVFEFRGDSADLLTGRDDIWSAYIDAIQQRADIMLFGCGAGNTVALLRINGSLIDNVPHNLYIEYFVQFGVLGLAALLTSWTEAFFNMKNKSVWFLIPALAFLVTAFSISANASDCIFITLLLLSMPMVSKAENKQFDKGI